MLALALALVLAQAKATPEYIKAFRYGVSDKRANQLALKIDVAAAKYELDPCLVAALVRVESNFDSDIMMCWPVVRNNVCTSTCDRGLGQINQIWIKTWKLSPWKLQYDDQYNLLVMARLLRQLQDQHPDDPQWFLYYHNALPFYQKRYWAKLKPFMDQCQAATLASGAAHDSVCTMPR